MSDKFDVCAVCRHLRVEHEAPRLAPRCCVLACGCSEFAESCDQCGNQLAIVAGPAAGERSLLCTECDSEHLEELLADDQEPVRAQL